MTRSDIFGKWVFGYRDTIQSKVHSLKLWHYKFYEDGTYKEYRRPFFASRTYYGRYPKGTWDFVDGKLIMDEKDYKVTNLAPETFEIIIINKKLFWDIGEESPGKKVYMFYKKR
ncbi:MAG: hypothetical protein C0448_11105 [Sphingobacteriaceae bacterium]|nr:hypothetical protein [Sphingobacteriaceae bacterium]